MMAQSSNLAPVWQACMKLLGHDTWTIWMKLVILDLHTVSHQRLKLIEFVSTLQESFTIHHVCKDLQL